MQSLNRRQATSLLVLGSILWDTRRTTFAQQPDTAKLLADTSVFVATINSRRITRQAGNQYYVEQNPAIGVGFQLQVEQRQVFVTAAHVVGDTPANREIYATFPGQKPLRMSVVVSDPATDLAILEPVVPHPNARQSLQIGVPKAGKSCYLIGRIVSMEAARRVANVPDGSDKEIDPLIVQLNQADFITLKSPYDLEGKSGSPIVDTDGKVLGIFFSTSKQERAGQAFTLLATPIQKVVSFINQHANFRPIVGQAEVLKPAPRIAGFKLASQAPKGEADIDGLKVTFNAINDQARDVSQRFSWASTSAQYLPPGVRPRMNEPVLAIVGPGDIGTDGKDRYIENNFMRFSTVLGSSFSHLRESIDLQRNSYFLDAYNPQFFHHVYLHASPVSKDLFYQNLRALNLDSIQNELAVRRRSILKVFLDGKDQFPITEDQRRVSFGPANRLLEARGHNWTTFVDSQGRPWCTFRYRSYVTLGEPPTELVTLYVYQVQSGMMFTAWFEHPHSAALNFQPQPIIIDKWVFLLALCVPQI